jgi:hypothetical protein
MKLSLKDKIAYSSAGSATPHPTASWGPTLFFLTTIGHVTPVLAGPSSRWDRYGMWSGPLWPASGPTTAAAEWGEEGRSCWPGRSDRGILQPSVQHDSRGTRLQGDLLRAMVLVFWTGFSTFFVPYLALERNLRMTITSGRSSGPLHTFQQIGTLVARRAAFDPGGSAVGLGVRHGKLLADDGRLSWIVSAASICTTVALSKQKDKACPREVVKACPREGAEKRALSAISRIWKGLCRRIEAQADPAPAFGQYLLSHGQPVLRRRPIVFLHLYLKFDTASSSFVPAVTSMVGLFFAPVIMALTQWLDKRSLLIVCMLISAVLVASAKFTGITTIARHADFHIRLLYRFGSLLAADACDDLRHLRI